MPPIVPDYVPRHFAQGTTLKFTRSLPDFSPSDGWTYVIYLNGLTQKANQAGVAADPATFLIEFDPSVTSTLPPGPYRYAERLSNPGTAFVLTGVEALGGAGIYSFSSYSNVAPYIGMPVSIAGFTNAGNNLSNRIITAFSGGPDGGTFTVTNASAVNETAAATAQGAVQVYDITGDELVIIIEPSAKDSPAGAFSTFEEQQLAAIEAALAGRIPSGMEHYQVAGRAVSKISIKDLMQLRGIYKAVVWRQQHPGKLGKPFKVEFPTGREATNLPPTWQDVTGLDWSGG